MAKIRISAYTDKLSVKPGGSLSVMASADATMSVRASLVRLIHGDEHPAGPGFIEQPVPSSIERDWPVRKQYIQKGNFLEVADDARLLALSGAFTLHAFMFPTLPAEGRQVILGRWSIAGASGYALGIDTSGRLEFWVGDGVKADAVAADVPLTPHTWYFVAASFDPARGTATLYQEPVVNRYNSLNSRIVPIDHRSHIEQALRATPKHADGARFLIGGAADSNPARGVFVSQCYSGKIDRCGVHALLSSAELDAIRAGGPPPPSGMLAYWDTSAGYGETGIGDRVLDTGPHGLHALGVNCPVRGQTGWNWNGRNDCFRLAPHEYGGVEFHRDALTDCRWTPTLSFVIPSDLRCGVYAVKLTAGEGADGGEEYTPFVVRPTTPKAAICLILPTASYLAYANGTGAFDAPPLQSITATTSICNPSTSRLTGTTSSSGSRPTTCMTTARGSATRPTAARSSTCAQNTGTRAEARRGSSPPTSRSSAGSNTTNTITKS